jgi:hypothetical protein
MRQRPSVASGVNDLVSSAFSEMVLAHVASGKNTHLVARNSGPGSNFRCRCRLERYYLCCNFRPRIGW